jgi:ABC-2 type transport system permease protein
MNWKKVYSVIRREYLERVRTKGFWIGTLLIPFLFLFYIGFQVAVMRKAGGERRIAVVDLTGQYLERLRAELNRPLRPEERDLGLKWVLEERPQQGSIEEMQTALRKEVLEKKINGYLILEPKAVDEGRVEYYSTTVSEWVALNRLERALNQVRIRRLVEERSLPSDIAIALEKRLDLTAFKVSKQGATEEKGAGILAALVFLGIMYGTFFAYGFQVLRGVLDEKNNRIVEVIVASVRPTELMIGKIVGIGLVGLTQYFVWSLVAMNISLPGIAAVIAQGGEGIPRIPMTWIFAFILYFLLGYFLYASVYCAIAAPFNTDQEAQQLAMIPMFLIISGFMVYPAVMNNPGGGISVFFSIFPFTASLVMFLRITVSEPPIWQILLSIGVMIATTFAIAWLAGRIYRVGILMYGKKPTIPEILRWVRYKPGKGTQPSTVTEA